MRDGARSVVTQEGRLSTAGVVGTAAVLAGVVAVASGHTLVAPLLADEEGESLRVLCDVGRDAIVANAGVGQLVRVAFVVLGSRGCDTGLLEADERALSLVLVTPVLPVGRRHAVWVDSVWVVVLSCGLSRGKASEGSEAERECGTHVDDGGRFEEV